MKYESTFRTLSSGSDRGPESSAFARAMPVRPSHGGGNRLEEGRHENQNQTGGGGLILGYLVLEGRWKGLERLTKHST